MQNDRTYVVVGIIQNQEGKLCIAQRPAHVHLAGLWEFPGGKLEANEDPFDGLKRELFEELGITVLNAKPYMAFDYDYPEKKVFLDFWLVDHFEGEAHGKEGQPVRWIQRHELKNYETPIACASVIDTLMKN